MNKYFFTCGDTNGIGPEIVIKTLNRVFSNQQAKFYFACPANVFEAAVKIAEPEFSFEIIKVNRQHSGTERVTVLDTGNVKLHPGTPTKHSGKAAFKSIKLAFDFVDAKKAGAMITAPISKTAINNAGYKFPGHTEMLAEWSGTNNFVMMFLSSEMNAALITIHEPIKKVSSLITRKLLKEKLDVIINCLINDLHIKQPRAAILGLNPHAGEAGLIGKEEEKVIIPAMKSPVFSEFLSGPYSPDAFFANKMHRNFDVVIGMYHDQVLIPFKMLNFSSGVNYTAGLPIIRTSPDHGTAFDIAYSGKADESSMYEAYQYAEKIINNRRPLIL
jgi:4-hydroxythreonine-4-phosphate dehydrogenase